MKQLKTAVIPAKAGIQEQAIELLKIIKSHKFQIDFLTAMHNEKLEQIARDHEECCRDLFEALNVAEKALMSLMKKNKSILFDGTDVVNLPPGSLIRNKVDKVSIPKTALAACKSQGFQEVIKVVESLDRDAIEQWPDAQLVLIGAERKPKEEFSYDLK
jgi:iron-sulfur cluster repair protein YtfE (RIC family)